MDGFTYENTAGGWHVCDICGVRVSHELKHAEWHKSVRPPLDPGQMLTAIVEKMRASRD